ncbi:MAG TPA: ABC-2 family transporter protein [Feifaniaceae bacterium]|nr:ABC-2 family transporter protein [Feifaniaceae bacterium]
MKRLLQLYAVSAKMDLAWLLRDRLFALLTIIADIVSTIASVSGVMLLAWRFRGIGGISEWEVLFMLAYNVMLGGVYIMFFASNNGHISRLIGRGQLEHLYVQPLPLPAQLLTMGFMPFSAGSGVYLGAGLMWWALSHMQLILPWWWAFALIGSLLVSLLVMLGASYLFSTAAFYAPVQAEEISHEVMDMFFVIGAIPLSGMPRNLQVLLVTLLPVGLNAWFPALVLLNKAPLGLPAILPLIVCGVLWAVTSIVFKKGLNYYVKKGVNRYSARGHRR